MDSWRFSGSHFLGFSLAIGGPAHMANSSALSTHLLYALSFLRYLFMHMGFGKGSYVGSFFLFVCFFNGIVYHFTVVIFRTYSE